MESLRFCFPLLFYISFSIHIYIIFEREKNLSDKNCRSWITKTAVEGQSHIMGQPYLSNKGIEILLSLFWLFLFLLTKKKIISLLICFSFIFLYVTMVYFSLNEHSISNVTNSKGPSCLLSNWKNHRLQTWNNHVGTSKSICTKFWYIHLVDKVWSVRIVKSCCLYLNKREKYIIMYVTIR